MHKLLEQLNKETVSTKSKELRITEKVYLMAPKLVEGLNSTKEDKQ